MCTVRVDIEINTYIMKIYIFVWTGIPICTEVIIRHIDESLKNSAIYDLLRDRLE
jgi:hypothetical protein